MPSLNNTNNIAVQVVNSQSGTGIKDTAQGIKKLGDDSQKTNGRFADFAKSAEAGLKKVSVVTGVLAVGLLAYTKNASDYYVNLAKDTKALSRQTGLSIEEASKLLAVTEKMGLESGDTSMAFGVLAKQIVSSGNASKATKDATADLKNKIEAAKIQINAYTKEIKDNGDKTGDLKNKIEAAKIKINGYKDAIDAATTPLERLKVKTQKADGTTRSFNDILLDIADRFKKMPDGAEKTAASMELFGRKGKDLIKVLNLGSDGIKTMESEAEKLGITLTQKNITQVSAYIAAQKKLKDSTNALKIQVGELTTPILTSFQLTVNGVIQSLIASDSPFRAATANVLAFGGPVLSATSSITAFAGNLASALPILSAMATFMTGPFGIAFLGASAIVGLVTGGLISQKISSERLSDAQKKLKDDTNNLKDSQEDLARSQLNTKSAALYVKEAQLAYNKAVKEYGPKSVEAQRANIDLQRAQLDYRDAVKDTKQKLTDLKTAQTNVAKDKTLIKHIQEVAKAFDGVTRSADNSITSISKFNTSKKTTNAVGQKIDLSPLVKKRAFGGPVQAGQPYIVGDNPDGSINNTSELFVPNQSGTIVPSGKTRQAMGGGGNTQHFHIGQLILGDSGAVETFKSWADKAGRNVELAKQGLTTVRT